MKKIFIPLLLLVMSSVGFAQTAPNPFPKTITVNGSAEIEIVPDEIYVQVDLREYDKKGQGKINIETIKNNFLSGTRAVGIVDSAISIASYDGNSANPWLRKKNKKQELFASISYLVKVKSSKQLDDLVEKLDDDATQNFFIQRTAHSKMAEYRKQLKIAAIKAAKEKGIYLTEALGEKLGEAVTINEPTEYYIPFYGNARTANVLMKQEAAISDSDDTAAVDFRKIKLKYDVSVVFALK